MIETGIEVAAGIEGEGIKFDRATADQLFGSFHNVALWLTPLLLALNFRLINMKWNHELVLPIYFLVRPTSPSAPRNLLLTTTDLFLDAGDPHLLLHPDRSHWRGLPHAEVGWMGV